MSTFDPETFMNATVDAPMATDFQMVPEGEYSAMIDDFGSDAFQTIEFTYKKGDRAGQPGVMHKLNLPLVIQDAAVQASLGREKVTVRAQINLDFNETGGLSTEKDRNVQLGRLREALNQNTAGAWSFAQLKGAGPLMVRVAHRNIAKQGEPDRMMAEVTRFGRLS